jgi:MFS transporter, DHA2 family, multidrug resistance protein
MSQTFEERREQFHVLRLGECLDPFNAAVASLLARPKRSSFSRPAIRLRRNNSLGSTREFAQASSLAYFDTFWMVSVLTFAVTFAVLFMRRSVAEKSGHAGSE